MSEATMRMQQIRDRMERLGITQQELADAASLSRGVVHRALHGATVSRVSLAALESAIDRLEGTVGQTVSTITMPDGVTVTFEGSPEGVAEAAAKFLAARREV